MLSDKLNAVFLIGLLIIGFVLGLNAIQFAYSTGATLTVGPIGWDLTIAQLRLP